MGPTSPDGTPIVVRPIARAELGRVLLRCLPDGGTIEGLFHKQGTVGMAAWEGEKCVGLLHGYRVAPPKWAMRHWPEWSNWFPGPEWWSAEAVRAGIAADAPIWCHACIHVGRTLAGSASDAPDARYFGRGIGTALAVESVRWAREHGYAAVLACAPPARLPQFAQWAGALPWTTYARLGFAPLNAPDAGATRSLRGADVPPHVRAEIEAAVAAGRDAADLRPRIMAFPFRPTSPSK